MDALPSPGSPGGTRPLGWRRTPALVLALLVGLGPLAVPAHERETSPERGHERDHDRARAARQAGGVLPLPVLLDKLRQSHPGEVLDVELEETRGRWVYEVKLLQADGRRLKLHLDARSGELLAQRERRPEPNR